MTKTPDIRRRVVILSILLGAFILGLKYLAYTLTGSTALKSDAIESVVNVVAAVFAFGAIIFADRPADRTHPYGHGKIEHFSAAFEGGLISLAAVFIIYEALLTLWEGPNLKALNTGLLINFGAGCLNGFLGWLLIRTGRKHNSHAIEADGHHVLSDFWTTLGLVAGLLLVEVTGFAWLDPLMALGVGILLCLTGYKLVRRSSEALLDMEDPGFLESLIEAANTIRPADVITIHGLRSLRTGRYSHVDIHIAVPEYYEIKHAHDLVDDFANNLTRSVGFEGEIHAHIDPCRRVYCSHCAVLNCPIRREPFTFKTPLTVEDATQPEPEDRA